MLFQSVALFSSLTLILSQSTTSTSTFTIPFYAAPNTFTPTATGNSAIPGAVVTIINSNGAGSLTDTFIYTKAASTVAPIGNATISATGAAASANNLQPNPANLQTAAARMGVVTPFNTFSVVSAAVVVALGAVGGVAMIF